MKVAPLGRPIVSSTTDCQQSKGDYEACGLHAAFSHSFIEPSMSRAQLRPLTRHPARSGDSSIEPIDGPIECSGKACPQQVGNEQGRGQSMQSRKLNDGTYDHHEED